MQTIWGTVDRLIHDLGAVRAVVDEMEALPTCSASPALTELRATMDEATEAITRIFSDTEDSVVEAAWRAMAHAQDAAQRARGHIATARAARHVNESVTEQARAQGARAREQREVIARTWRARERTEPAGPPSDLDDETPRGGRK